MTTTHLSPLSPADPDDVVLCGNHRANEVETIQQPYGTDHAAIMHFGYCVECITEYRWIAYQAWQKARDLEAEALHAKPRRRVLNPCYCDSAYHPKGC